MIETMLQGFKRGVYFFAELLANFTNTLLIVLVYFTVLAITSITAKIFKKKFLNYEIKSWSKFNQEKDKSLYFKQF